MKMRKTPTIVRLYLRRSKKDRDTQKFSIGTQRAEAREYISKEFPNADVFEYLDEASGDSWNRPGLERLVSETRPGDAIVCRDKGRLSRDMIGGPALLEELLCFRRARLFFYFDNKEIHFESANDRIVQCFDDFKYASELENNRGRTREALRRKVQNGKIAGGKCYGYKNVKGNEGTELAIDETQSKVIVRIFNSYSIGRGLKGIARDLNAAGVPGPRGDWKPSGLRSMLQNKRYQGWHIHGRIVKRKVSRVGRTQVKADAEDIITNKVPEWQIVSDELWEKVQARFTANKRAAPRMHSPARTMGRPPKYPLVGFSRCGHCGGSISSQRTKRGQTKTAAYGCATNWRSGKQACPISLQQPMHLVEGALANFLHEKVLEESILEKLMADVRAEAQLQLSVPTVDISALEAQLKEEHEQIRRLIKLAAQTGDEVGMISEEIQSRSVKIKGMKSTLAEASRPADEILTLLDQIEAEARSDLRDLRHALLADSSSRQVYQSLFPDGLIFDPVDTNKGNRVWALSGRAQLGPLSRATPTGFEPVSPA